MSHSAIERLSPAFPQRAPWGTSAKLRAWQAEALQHYLDAAPTDFLAVATPGAGKTTFALRVASELLHDRTVKKLIVVAPTEHLKVQWADAAAKVGIQLDPGLAGRRKGRSKQFDGVAVTYAGVAAGMLSYEAMVARDDTLVILDEVHHAGDSLSWGEAAAEAFRLAKRRLALTGTPFRSDTNPIPFVAYDEQPGGTRVSRADYTYGYAEALRDHVVRPVVFMNYGGPMRWRTKSGETLAANLGELLTKDVSAQAWRTALDPKGEWISAVLTAADRRLTEVRRHVPDAGGLVIATNQTQARAYAKVLASLTGEKPTVVLSDDPGSSKRIEAFAESHDRWMVAVRMVSEGVDVPRLAVGVSSGLGVAASWPRSSCPRCRSSWPTRPPWSGNATTSWALPRPRNSGMRPTPNSPQRTAPRRPPTTWRAASRRSPPRPPSIMCCSIPSSSACTPSRPRTTRPTTSVCPGCWRPTRSVTCCASGNVVK